MRIPDLRSAIVNGVPFVDLGGRAQSRHIGAAIDAHKAKLAALDPGALTPAERERLAVAEAKLAEAQAAHDSAAQRWVDLKAARWQGQHETTLVGGIKQRVMRSVPTEADVSTAERGKEATEHALQQTLIVANRERQEIDSARWWRRREAERGASAKGR